VHTEFKISKFLNKVLDDIIQQCSLGNGNNYDELMTPGTHKGTMEMMVMNKEP
jgi:hypothetical protein